MRERERERDHEVDIDSGKFSEAALGWSKTKGLGLKRPLGKEPLCPKAFRAGRCQLWNAPNSMTLRVQRTEESCTWVSSFVGY